jgi:hypothetical protein
MGAISAAVHAIRGRAGSAENLFFDGRELQKAMFESLLTN